MDKERAAISELCGEIYRLNTKISSLREDNKRLRRALHSLVKWYGVRDGEANDDLLPSSRQSPVIATAMELLETET